MKAVWADKKNQNKHSFIDKEKYVDSVKATVKLACDKEWNAGKMLGNCLKKKIFFTALTVLAWKYNWIILSESISLQHILI